MPSEASAILHVGAGKCGSSALQRSLSLKPAMRSASGRKVEYVVISNAGDVLRGPAITEIAERSVYGYASSPDPVTDAPVEIVAKGLRGVAGMAGPVLPVLSCEGWGVKHALFRDGRLLSQAGLEAEVVIYVRPQLDWLNSGWWQWGAWGGHPLERWLRHAVHEARWDRLVRAWREMPGVGKIHLRLATGDVPEDFGRLLGVELAGVGRVNTGSDGLLLRALQRFRGLRRHEHDAFFQFAFGKWAPGPHRPAPWVIPFDEGARLLAGLADSNRALMALADPGTAGRIRDDPRWWSVDAYRDREVEPAELADLPNEAYAELLERAFQALSNRIQNRPPGS